MSMPISGRTTGSASTRAPTCYGQLFQIHGSKFKLDPVCNLGQASVLSIAHGVFFLGVGKDSFNGLLAPLVQFLVLWGVAGVVGQFFIILPDMPLYCFDTVFGMGAQMAGGAVGTDLRVASVLPVSVPVGGPVCQHLVFRAEHAVIMGSDCKPSPHPAIESRWLLH